MHFIQTYQNYDSSHVQSRSCDQLARGRVGWKWHVQTCLGRWCKEIHQLKSILLLKNKGPLSEGISILQNTVGECKLNGSIAYGNQTFIIQTWTCWFPIWNKLLTSLVQAWQWLFYSNSKLFSWFYNIHQYFYIIMDFKSCFVEQCTQYIMYYKLSERL